MFKSGIRKKRKFILYRSSIFGDITIIDTILLLATITITILVIVFLPSILWKVLTVFFTWTSFFWLIWETNNYKGYEIISLWLSFLGKPKKYSLDYLINEYNDEENNEINNNEDKSYKEETNSKHIVYQVVNGIDISSFLGPKKEEIVQRFNEFLGVNEFPLKIIKTHNIFPLIKNNLYLQKQMKLEEDKNKSLVIENFIELNKVLLQEKEDFTFYLYFEFYSIKDKNEIDYNLNILRDIGINIKESKISKRQLLSRILGSTTGINEHKNYFDFEEIPGERKRSSISKVNFNGVDLGEFWFNDIILNPYANFVFTIEKADQTKAVKIYEKYLTNRKNNFEDTKKVQEEIKSESDYYSNRKVLSDVILGFDTLIKCEIDVIISSPEEEYKKVYRDIKNILKMNSIKLNSVWFEQHEKIESLLKFRQEKEYFLMPQRTIAWFFPFVNFNYIDEKGLLLGFLNEYKPFVYNPLNLTNRSNFINLVIGKTGSGKTTLMKLVILTLLTLSKSRVIIIDPHNEYDYFLDFFVGKKINFNSQNIINPFAFNYVDPQKTLNDHLNEKISLISNFIEILFQDNIYYDIETFSNFRKHLKLFFVDFYEFYKKEEFVNKAKLLEKQATFAIFNAWIHDENIKRQILSPFIGGIYNIFNKEQNIEIDEPLIIFNTFEILKTSDKNLKKANYFLIMDYINGTMYENDFKNNKFLSIIIDESHLFFNDFKTLTVISKMVREARKFNTMIMLGTQNISDFSTEDNNLLQSIFSNTSNLFIGKIEAEEIKLLNSLLETKMQKLNQYEIEHFQKARGNFLYLNEKNNILFKVDFDDFTKHLILRKEQIQDNKEY